jgi:hypothetical protein
MTRRAIRWSLLLPMAAFVPLLFYMFVVGGFLPYTAILVFTLRNLSNHSLLLFNAVHLIVYGLLLYLAAGSIARLICRLPERRRLVIAGLIVLILAFVGFQPIFGAGHGSFEFKNAFQIYGSWLR